MCVISIIDNNTPSALFKSHLYNNKITFRYGYEYTLVLSDSIIILIIIRADCFLTWQVHC